MSLTISILLVDDVEYSRDLLRGSLLTCTHEHKMDIETNFFHSSTGADIIDVIKYNKIDLVYLDIDLPHISGLNVLKEIRENYPKLMVVMVSGESSIENVTTAIRSGANGFIVKPFNSGRILETVENYLKRLSKQKAKS
jgi:two-component system chemotaxis response regulator CheY